MPQFIPSWLRQVRQAGLDKPARAVYNTYDARNLFSQLVRRARRGEEIVIAHAGTPVAKLVPYTEDVPTRPGIFRLSLYVDEGGTGADPEAPPQADGATPTRSSPAAST
jgi:prevent-host-death family protein